MTYATEKQENYIQVLNRQGKFVGTGYEDEVTYGLMEGFKKERASYLISVALENQVPVTVSNSKAIRSQVWKTVCNKKSKKNANLLAEIKSVLGFEIWNKDQPANLTDEQCNLVAHLF